MTTFISEERDVAVYFRDGEDLRFLTHVTVYVYDPDSPADVEALAFIKELIRIHKETPEVFEDRKIHSWIRAVIDNYVDDEDDFYVIVCPEYWPPLPFDLELDLNID